MALTYNGTRPSKITYNGSNVKTVTYNGVVVWGQDTKQINAIDYADDNYTMGNKTTFTSTAGFWFQFPLPAYSNIVSMTATINSSNWSHVAGAATYSCHLYASTAMAQDNMLAFVNDSDGYLTPNGNYTVTIADSSIATINSVKPSNIWYRFGISKKTSEMKTTVQINSLYITITYTI